MIASSFEEIRSHKDILWCGTSGSFGCHGFGPSRAAGNGLTVTRDALAFGLGCVVDGGATVTGGVLSGGYNEYGGGSGGSGRGGRRGADCTWIGGVERWEG